jgi:uncharacterized protein YbcI
MVTSGNTVAPFPGGTCRQTSRTQGQREAEITQRLIRFKRERLGRGPGDIKTRIVQDMVIVRMTDALTPQEEALVQSGDVELLKKIRARLLETGRAELDRILQQATGCSIASMYGDLCPETRERVIVFVLAGTPAMAVH